ncbi:sigma-E factor negative regulatory protein [Neptunicella marina]|uniref:Anti-sigma-E factor RseA n=1 Tax=Neptunicella marina TaxID=2125989 RepID=A0A8J6M3D4_9ALTE|nr:RseA family anti-sigma factor [Neptunicella marina]MBC3766882.1 transcriptional regulator [Neptunicella marina]
MTQQKYEKLSAWVDGEIHHDGLVDDLKNDAELMQKWQGYHLVRDALRKETPDQLNFDIAANVAAALENEPTLLAPKKSTWRDWPVVGNVIPLVRNAGQFAIAASVATAMIIGVQNYNQPKDVETNFESNSGFSGLGVQGGLSPVSLEQSRALPRQSVQEQQRKIIAFLTDHQQQMRRKTTELEHNNPQQVTENETEQAEVSPK